MPEVNKHCENCMWWSHTYDDGLEHWGTCENLFVFEKIKVVQDVDNTEEPTIFTEAMFGCINFSVGDFLVEIK